MNLGLLCGNRDPDQENKKEDRDDLQSAQGPRRATRGIQSHGRECSTLIARVKTEENEALLCGVRWRRFENAGQQQDSTPPCRGIELKHLRWQDLDLFKRIMVIRRSNTDAATRPQG